MRLILPILLTLLFAPIASAAGSISVKDAWVRLPPPGSQIGVAYLTLEPKQNMVLTSAQSPAAKTVELHSMSMNDGVVPCWDGFAVRVFARIPGRCDVCLGALKDDHGGDSAGKGMPYRVGSCHMSDKRTVLTTGRV